MTFAVQRFYFITRLYYSMDIFTVFGKLFWDIFPWKKVANVLKFGECVKINFTDNV